MLSKKKGSILITGNTAATRGKSHWGFFASTKAAQRILAESIAREFGPKGIHVAYFIIDAAIDLSLIHISDPRDLAVSRMPSSA